MIRSEGLEKVSMTLDSILKVIVFFMKCSTCLQLSSFLDLPPANRIWGGPNGSFHCVLILIISFQVDHISPNKILSKTLWASLESLCGSLH